jgi:NADP-dependent 3-hydroxy acid dehydrogenase YdfG
VKAVVTGASRGFGQGIARALAAEGIDVVGVARGAEPLQALATELGDRFAPVVGDAADPTVAAELVALHRPDVLVLNAGAVPPLAPVHEQTWEAFAQNWETDTRHVFEWVGAALRLPLAPGSLVVVISSGAALRGSPMSGGYAGAKATVRFIASYAAGESDRAELGLRVVTLLPQLTPLTAVGAAGAAAYAQRQGISVAAYTRGFEPLLTPELVGTAVVEAIKSPGHQELILTGSGPRPVPPGGR